MTALFIASVAKKILNSARKVMSMSTIPVFVSCPTNLSEEQNQKRENIIQILENLYLEPRALGRSDYPTKSPLNEVYSIARCCRGGVILGFEQLFIKSGRAKRGIPDQEKGIRDQPIPTPWNNLEAGLLFGLKLPLLVFKEERIDGGIFDYGISDIFIHNMPPAQLDEKKIDELNQIFLSWYARVKNKYQAY